MYENGESPSIMAIDEAATGLVIWAVPRSRSTALERSFMQRAKTKVTHEHLTSPNGGQVANSSEILAQHLKALSDMSDTASDDDKQLYVAKELTCYAPLSDPGFDNWLRCFRHVILVRDPLPTLASLKRVGIQGGGTAYFNASEAGFREALLLKERISAACGEAPLTIDADTDLMANSQGTLMRICEYANVPYDPAMLSWKSEEVKEWQKLKGWHDDVQRTTGFTQEKATEEKWLADADVVTAANECRVWYEQVLSSSVR